ncbi:MAG TPA: Na+/H+ antiporter NhaA [Bdellovibrionales bacterium]|jgi:NhaA family Na+:H+ antiporter|nr:Na+/H+ antiporter NhaA [Bdellovibrionales bacterium]
MPSFSTIFSNIQKFWKLESASGFVLAAAAVIAIAIANSPLNDAYQRILSTAVGPLSVSHWINDGLMALFFFVVGMEIKYELIDGALNSVERAALPIVAAIGGMVVPAAIFLGFNLFKEHMHGWGIPMATDIAFAVGVMTVLGKRVPAALKVFLLALAIADDLGAVIVIAVFYTSGVKLMYLLAAVALLVVIRFAASREVRWVPLHILLGLAVWYLVHEAGVHATIAGCALGFLMPHDDMMPSDPTPLERWIHRLHPIVGFGIMPIFALANAGIVFSGIDWSGALTHPLVLGIAVGLAIGKPLGIFGASWLAIRFGIAKAPEGVRSSALLAAGCLGGIGFTMALFIAGLALKSEQAMILAKVGIIGGSIVSAALGAIILLRQPER